MVSAFFEHPIRMCSVQLTAVSRTETIPAHLSCCNFNFVTFGSHGVKVHTVPPADVRIRRRQLAVSCN